LHTFKLNLAVSYVGHVFQTYHLITSNEYVQLLKKYLQNYFCLMRQNRRCLSNIHLKSIGFTAINVWSVNHWNTI